jgi:hypothetical protein
VRVNAYFSWDEAAVASLERWTDVEATGSKRRDR